MSDPRPVWLTREQIVQVELAARTPWYGMPQVENAALMAVVRKWNAAPADAAQAAEAALVDRYGTAFADGTGRNVANSVLCALGMPDASPTETEPHEH